MIALDSLYIMQDGIRHTEQVPGMIEYVRNGGIWTQEALETYALEHKIKIAPIMEISRFPDGQMMIHDGHHRGVATYLGGRTHFYPEEYQILDWNYEDYSEVNLDKRWVTPFDPRVDLRVPDIFTFKKKALELASVSMEDTLRFIAENKHLYAIPRSYYYLSELAERYRHRKENDRSSVESH